MTAHANILVRALFWPLLASR